MNEEDQLPLEDSRSKRRREALAITDLGKQLIALNVQQIQSLPLTDLLQNQIIAAKTMERGALKRQTQYIGKLLRSIESEPIAAALARLNQPHLADTKRLHQLERWREQLLTGDPQCFEQLLQEYPALDRQKLSQLIRQTRKEQETGQTAVYFRKLFTYLKTLC